MFLGGQGSSEYYHRDKCSDAVYDDEKNIFFGKSVHKSGELLDNPKICMVEGGIKKEYIHFIK